MDITQIPLLNPETLKAMFPGLQDAALEELKTAGMQLLTRNKDDVIALGAEALNALLHHETILALPAEIPDGASEETIAAYAAVLAEREQMAALVLAAQAAESAACGRIASNVANVAGVLAKAVLGLGAKLL